MTEEGDRGADGTVDSRTTWTYDSDGNKLTEEYDYDGDGTVDGRRTYTYEQGHGVTHGCSRSRDPTSHEQHD